VEAAFIGGFGSAVQRGARHPLCRRWRRRERWCRRFRGRKRAAPWAQRRV